MIRFTTQLWQSAVVAALVTFAGSQVEAGGLGKLGGSIGHATGVVHNQVGGGVNTVKQQAHQQKQNVGNAFNAAKQNAQKYGNTANNAVNHAKTQAHHSGHKLNQTVEYGKTASQTGINHTNKVIHQTVKQGQQATNKVHQQAVNLQKQTESLGKNTAANANTALTTVKKSSGQAQKTLNTAPTSARNLGKPFGQVVNQGKKTIDHQKNVFQKLASQGTASAKGSVRPPQSASKVHMPKSKLPKVKLPSGEGLAPVLGTLPTLNPKQDAKNALAIAAFAVDAFTQASREQQQADAGISPEPTTGGLVTDEVVLGYTLPGEVPPVTTPSITSETTFLVDAPVNQGLELATSIVNLVGQGIANGSSVSRSSTSAEQPFDFGTSELSPASVSSADPLMLSEAEAETPATFEYVVQNLTEQSLTYSIRAAGTQWGTYTLVAGKTHKFVGPQEEMEVQYTSSQGEQTISIPGDHLYAFADIDGEMELCNADPEDESETVTE